MDQKRFESLLARVEELRKGKKFDLSTDEDLSIAVMNLVSLEEHFFFTASKTGKDEYLDLLHETRALRKELLGRMMEKNEGETWCISKHLLAATMRLMEVGTKLYSGGEREDAKKMFGNAYKVYSLFWALRLKLIDTKGVTRVEDGALNVHDEKKSEKPWSFEDIVSKLVDCCDEK